MVENRVRLVGTHEIRLLLGGISRQRVYQLTRRGDFPRPAADLGQGKVWFTDDVEEWISNRRRRVG
jgi:prophage regulatory protein